MGSNHGEAVGRSGTGTMAFVKDYPNRYGRIGCWSKMVEVDRCNCRTTIART